MSDFRGVEVATDSGDFYGEEMGCEGEFSQRLRNGITFEVTKVQFIEVERMRELLTNGQTLQLKFCTVEDEDVYDKTDKKESWKVIIFPWCDERGYEISHSTMFDHSDSTVINGNLMICNRELSRLYSNWCWRGYESVQDSLTSFVHQKSIEFYCPNAEC